MKRERQRESKEERQRGERVVKVGETSETEIRTEIMMRRETESKMKRKKKSANLQLSSFQAVFDCVGIHKLCIVLLKANFARTLCVC